jgi:hypothetical protein
VLFLQSLHFCEDVGCAYNLMDRAGRWVPVLVVVTSQVADGLLSAHWHGVYIPAIPTSGVWVVDV